MDRPETIELVGQTLRWSEERCGWESAEPGARPRIVAWYNRWENFWRAVASIATVRLEVEADDPAALDLALRAALAEVADAVAAWLPEREARIHADAAKMAMELAAQRNALAEAIDTVCGLDHELKSTGGAVPSNALDALRGWEARVRAEERERCEREAKGVAASYEERSDAEEASEGRDAEEVRFLDGCAWGARAAAAKIRALTTAVRT